ncbi:hypothetical protein [Nocardia cyriacigeorgica]|uniref:PPE domain-containing protein n=1 Tax=Nocardia cyriacigeorgica TaxID=135487 RepID=A0A5R8P2Q2_9NOCA|nr:hypothetical protein [Nocardia cyriacigeorgica]TLF82567.1 hypothetical protein FEK34_02195 [Nocardia cyriacigeorgica]
MAVNIIPTFIEVGQAIGRMVLDGPINDLKRTAAAFGIAHGDASPDATMARNRIDEIKRNGLDVTSQESQVRTYENLHAMDQQKLYDNTQAMNLTTVVQIHEMWEGIRNRMEVDQQRFGPQMQKAIAEKWQGAGAAAAANGIGEYAGKSQNLVGSVQIMAEKVKLIRSAMELVRPAVPPPPDDNIVVSAASWVPGPTWRADEKLENSSKNSAIRVLENVLYPAVKETDTEVPLVPPPYNPIHEPNQPVVPPPGRGWEPPPGKSGPEPGGPGGENGKPEEPGATGEEPTTPAGANTQSLLDDNALGSTTPAGLGSPQPSTAAAGMSSPGSSGLPGSTGIGTGGGLGSGGSGSGGPGLGGVAPGVPGAGRSLPGQPGAAAGPGTAGASTNSVGRGAGMRGGMPGMMGAPGARGGKDDERESDSKIKEYLVTQENGEELTGLGEAHRAKTVPPVLGE